MKLSLLFMVVFLMLVNPTLSRANAPWVLALNEGLVVYTSNGKITFGFLGPNGAHKFKDGIAFQEIAEFARNNFGKTLSTFQDMAHFFATEVSGPKGSLISKKFPGLQSLNDKRVAIPGSFVLYQSANYANIVRTTLAAASISQLAAAIAIPAVIIGTSGALVWYGVIKPISENTIVNGLATYDSWLSRAENSKSIESRLALQQILGQQMYGKNGAKYKMPEEFIQTERAIDRSDKGR